MPWRSLWLDRLKYHHFLCTDEIRNFEIVWKILRKKYGRKTRDCSEVRLHNSVRPPRNDERPLRRLMCFQFMAPEQTCNQTELSPYNLGGLLYNYNVFKSSGAFCDGYLRAVRCRTASFGSNFFIALAPISELADQVPYDTRNYNFQFQVFLVIGKLISFLFYPDVQKLYFFCIPTLKSPKTQ